TGRRAGRGMAGGGAGRRCGAVRMHRRPGCRVRGLRAGIGGGARGGVSGRGRVDPAARAVSVARVTPGLWPAFFLAVHPGGLPAQPPGPTIEVSTAPSPPSRGRVVLLYARPTGGPDSSITLDGTAA